MQVKENLPSLQERENQPSPQREDDLTQSLTEHARARMLQRGICNAAVFQTIAFGRISRGRGATIYAVGKKEIAEFAEDGIDLSFCEGVHVVMTRRGLISTVYRNLSMPKLKPRRRMPERIFKQNMRRQNARSSFALMSYA